MLCLGILFSFRFMSNDPRARKGVSRSTLALHRYTLLVFPSIFHGGCASTRKRLTCKIHFAELRDSLPANLTLETFIDNENTLPGLKLRLFELRALVIDPTFDLTVYREIALDGSAPLVDGFSQSNFPILRLFSGKTIKRHNFVTADFFVTLTRKI